jgi:hypothetical protein
LLARAVDWDWLHECKKGSNRLHLTDFGRMLGPQQVAIDRTWILVAWWHAGSGDAVAQELMLSFFFQIYIISF